MKSIESNNIIINNVTPTSSSTSHKHRIIIDSGCSEHLTCRFEWLRNIRSLVSPITVRGAFGKSSTAFQCGDMYLSLDDNNFVVKDVIYCNSLQDTLLSLCRLINHGHRVDFSQKKLLPKSGTFSISLSMVGNILTFADDPPSDITSTSEALVVTRSRVKQSKSVLSVIPTSSSSSIPPQDQPTPPSETSASSNHQHLIGHMSSTVTYVVASSMN